MKKGNIQGARAVIEALEAQGVEYIFGYPGGATLPIYDALVHSKIKHILARHEQGAAHMADGYARASGKIGVCIATSGPGATNLVTGIATAFMDSSPIVAITGQVPQSMIGNDAFQEVDITGITLPITKHNYLIQNPEEILPVFEQAFYLAGSGRKGPVLIDIPKNVLSAEFQKDKSKPLSLEGYNPTTKGHPGQIKKAVKLLEQSERPVIIAGGGAAGGGTSESKALLELSEKCGIPVVATLMGKNSFPNRHPHYLGLYGYHGRVASNKAVSEADIILSIGTRFTDRSTGPLGTFAADARIIHIDIDPAEISKNVPSFMPIVGDSDQILPSILNQIKAMENKEWLNHCLTIKKENELSEGKGSFSIPKVLNHLQARLGNSPVTTDVGRHQIFAAHHLATEEGVPFITSGGLGTMGFGFPAAIGAALGRKGDRIVVISGDGSFQMNCQELTTAAENNLPITVLVMNDSQLGMIHQLQDAFYGKRYESCIFKQIVDYPALAKSMGANGGRAENLEELDRELNKAEESGKTYVIDCILSMGENTYPMVTGKDLTCFMEEQK